MWNGLELQQSIIIRHKNVIKHIGVLRKTVLRILVAIVVLTMTASVAYDASASIEPSDVSGSMETDPLTIVRLFTERISAGQIDSAVTLLASDMVVMNSAGTVLSGKAQVHRWLHQLKLDRIELCDIWILGTEIAWSVRIYNGDTFRIGSARAVIEDGQIELLADVTW